MYSGALLPWEWEFRPTRLPAGPNQDQDRQQSLLGAVVSSLGLASAEPGAHHQRQITGRSLQEQFLLNVAPTPDPQPVHPAGVELMREVALDPFPTLGKQAPAPLTPNPPPVGMDRFFFRLSAFPLSPSALRLGDVTPHLHLTQVPRHLVAVISLVGDNFLHPLRMDLVFPFRCLLRDQARHSHSRLTQGLLHRFRIGCRAAMRRHRHGRWLPGERARRIDHVHRYSRTTRFPDLLNRIVPPTVL